MKNFPIKGWKWIFYVLGWISSLNILFWAYQTIAYFWKNEKHYFSEDFHRRVVYWGMLSTIIALILTVILAMKQ